MLGQQAERQQALGKSGKEKLPFSRMKPLGQPGSVRASHFYLQTEKNKRAGQGDRKKHKLQQGENRSQ